MRFLLIALCVALLLPQGLGENIIRGKITVTADGLLIFEGHLERDNLNVTYAMLNTARDTPIATAQSVYVVFNGTSLGHEPANAPVGGDDSGNYTYVTVNSINTSLEDYLALQHKGFAPGNASSEKAFLEKRGDSWYFALHLDEWMDVYDLEMVFPDGTEFKEITTNMNYERAENSLHFEGKLVEAPKVDVIYSIKKLPERAELPIVLYAVIAVIAIAGALTYYKFSKKKRLNEDILKTLNDKEASAIRLLAAEGGKLTQTRLRQKTGMPKSTLSNLIRDLEAKKLLQRYEHGSTWDVELDKRAYR